MVHLSTCGHILAQRQMVSFHMCGTAKAGNHSTMGAPQIRTKTYFVTGMFQSMPRSKHHSVPQSAKQSAMSRGRPIGPQYNRNGSRRKITPNFLRTLWRRSRFINSPEVANLAAISRLLTAGVGDAMRLNATRRRRILPDKSQR